MSKTLDWTEFKDSSEEEWLDEFNKSLKSPFQAWNPAEKIFLNPIYFRESGFSENVSLSTPNLSSGIVKWGNDWLVNELITSENPALCNKHILSALNQGVDAICIDVRKFAVSDLNLILKDVIASIIRIDLIVDREPSAWLNELDKIAGDKSKTRGSIIFDPFSSLEKSLQDSELEAGLNEWYQLVQHSTSRSGKIRSAVIDSNAIHNSGANACLELAISIAKAHELLVFMLEKGMAIDEAAALFEFRLGIGSSFFTELAKFRAIRKLWANIVSAYNPQFECSTHVAVHGQTSAWNLSAADTNTNLLRLTTEAMSAIYGSCDSLSILPHDLLQSGGTDFSARLARNIQFLLKEESFAAKVADPAAGAMYVEEYTNQICENSWEIFLQIEQEGGYTKSVLTGSISQRINSSRAALSDEIRSGKKTWLGVNKYKSGTYDVISKQPIEQNSLYPALELEKLLNENRG